MRYATGEEVSKLQRILAEDWGSVANGLYVGIIAAGEFDCTQHPYYEPGDDAVRAAVAVLGKRALKLLMRFHENHYAGGAPFGNGPYEAELCAIVAAARELEK